MSLQNFVAVAMEHCVAFAKFDIVVQSIAFAALASPFGKNMQRVRSCTCTAHWVGAGYCVSALHAKAEPLRQWRSSSDFALHSPLAAIVVASLQTCAVRVSSGP